MNTDVTDFESTPPPGLGFGRSDRFPDLILPGVETERASRLFELGGEQVLVHLFASW